MPKRNFVNIRLPLEQPDCCQECPLLGKIPQDFAGRPKGSYETLICLGTMDAMSLRQSKVRASNRDVKHPLHRYCDRMWPAWVNLARQELPISIQNYNMFRIPFVAAMQPMIKFHTAGRPSRSENAVLESKKEDNDFFD